ncbi:MAG: hypothetical protein HOZ81_20265 [Streptomyces sp.]|nr:hypothetical protein [Streptomyces sp.]NUS81876.1 hypothetical protein [Streptomyces sp.]
MSGRAWLKHPARTIGQRPPCPTGLPRFANVDLARAALHHGLGAPSLEAWTCSHCEGAHISDTDPTRST